MTARSSVDTASDPLSRVRQATGLMITTAYGSWNEDLSHWHPVGSYDEGIVDAETRTPLRPIHVGADFKLPDLNASPTALALNATDGGTCTIHLVRQVGSGALWDVYLARVDGVPGEVVAKVTDLTTFPDRQRPTYDDSESEDGGDNDNNEENSQHHHAGHGEDLDCHNDAGHNEDHDSDDDDDMWGGDTHTRTEAASCVAVEAYIYTSVGRDLQGSVLPRFGGLFGARQFLREEVHGGESGENGTPGTEIKGGKEAERQEHSGGPQLLCMVMEDVGPQLEYAELADKVNQDAVLKLYEKLHAAGAVHGDIDRRHMRRGDRPPEPVASTGFGFPAPTPVPVNPAAIRLIDFDHSTVPLGRFSNDQWETSVGLELRKVRSEFRIAIECWKRVQYSAGLRKEMDF